MTAARFLAYHTPQDGGNGFLDYDHMTADRFTFMASTRTEVSREFYKGIKQSQTAPKLAINLHIGYIGMSSLNSVATLDDLEDPNGKPWVRNINQVVSVDKGTRKPAPLPEWWTEKYKEAVVGNQRLIVRAVEVSPNPHVYEFKVMWSDIDRYKHVNYVSYIRFCLDAAMDAVVKGHLSKFKDDILNYNVKLMEISYKGESLANDELKVLTWENLENPWKLHFDISKNGTCIFQNTIEYYSQEEK